MNKLIYTTKPNQTKPNVKKINYTNKIEGKEKQEEDTNPWRLYLPGGELGS